MTREDFLYACENEGLINCERDDHNKIDVEETVNDSEFNRGFWTPRGEWLSLKVIYNILEDQGAFED